MKQIAEALVKVQKALRPVIKDSVNDAFKRPGSTGSKYADLTTVWEACREVLTANNLCVVQTTDFDGDGAWVRTMLLHTSGESIDGRFPLRPTKPDMQGMGSALTYARRYGLCALIGVVADDDDDGNAASVPVQRAQAVQPEGVAEPAKADRKAAANKWGNDTLAKIPNMSEHEYSLWIKDKMNLRGVEVVREHNETLHKKLTEAMRTKERSFAVAAE